MQKCETFRVKCRSERYSELNVCKEIIGLIKNTTKSLNISQYSKLVEQRDIWQNITKHMAVWSNLFLHNILLFERIEQHEIPQSPQNKLKTMYCRTRVSSCQRSWPCNWVNAELHWPHFTVLLRDSFYWNNLGIWICWAVGDTLDRLQVNV